ncbi:MULTISPECIES: DUF4160 domain-containing protein [Haemophilus]|uniref:DUF4160 domain-containing protein n=1 Tax=Haemophilus TaxID=724 RepID=UPI000AF2B43E|nr:MULTISPECIES: DUF4160 domain-containing protein [Haemophilus]
MQNLEQITEQALDAIARNEGNPLEPAHIHVCNAESEAKFWLEPNISLARNDGFNSKELKEIFVIVETHRMQFTEA